MRKGIYWAIGKCSGAKFLVDVGDADAPIGTVLKRSGTSAVRGDVGSAVRLCGLRDFVKIPGPITLAAFRESAAAAARVTPAKPAASAGTSGTGSTASA